MAPADRSLPFSVVGRPVCREPVAEAIHGSPETRSDPRDRGQTYRVRRWRSRTKPWWESRTDAADCCPSGPGPSGSGLWRAGGGSAPIYVNRGGCVRWRGRPWPLSQERPWTRIPGSQWAFTGRARAPDPQGPPLGWAGSSGALVCGPPTQRVGSTPGPGAVSSAHRANCPGIPLGPFDVAGHAPFPKLPCLPNRAGFSRLFTFHTRPLASIAPARSCEAWRDTGRSLQCLHLDPSLSLPPFPTPLPNSSVPSWRPVPAAVPDRHPQGSEWPWSSRLRPET